MELVVENENLQKALQLRKEGNPEAVVWLEKAIVEGDGVAFFFKGRALWYGGFFLKKDEDNAKIWFEQSAKAGCPWGMVRYAGDCEGDEKLAWYAKALATNDDFACGVCFCKGHGVEKNLEKGRECLLRAAQQGSPFAQALLGESLCGSEKESIFWLEKAVIYGDANAQHNLAYKYLREKGVEKSYEKAVFWYLQGARQKHSACCRLAALYYEKGLGCEKNLPMSAVFYLEHGDSSNIITRLSTKFDDPVVRLQELFVYGKGLKKDAKLRAEVGEENCANAIRIYEESTTAAQKAVLCFIWICKQSKCLNRDMQRAIGKIVFESHEDPSVWNVGLQQNALIALNKM